MVVIFHSDPKPIWFLLSSLPLFHLPLLTASALLNPFSSLHLTVHPSRHLLLHVHSPPYVADKYEIKKVPTSLLFVAMPHQRHRNCLYEHASSIPVQNKTNQFSQKVKLSSPHCHERDWLLQSSSNRTSRGPSLLSCSSWILKCMSA